MIHEKELIMWYKYKQEVLLFVVCHCRHKLEHWISPGLDLPCMMHVHWSWTELNDIHVTFINSREVCTLCCECRCSERCQRCFIWRLCKYDFSLTFPFLKHLPITSYIKQRYIWRRHWICYDLIQFVRQQFIIWRYYMIHMAMIWYLNISLNLLQNNMILKAMIHHWKIPLNLIWYNYNS